METQPRGTGTMSKKRYEEISQLFKEVEDDAEKLEKLLKILQTVLNFHPEASNYTIYKSKLKENESTYQKAKKDYYERHKVEINAKVKEKKRLARLQASQT